MRRETSVDERVRCAQVDRVGAAPAEARGADLQPFGLRVVAQGLVEGEDFGSYGGFAVGEQEGDDRREERKEPDGLLEDGGEDGRRGEDFVHSMHGVSRGDMAY